MRFVVVLSLLLAGLGVAGCKGGGSPMRDATGDGVAVACEMCSPNATCVQAGGATIDGGADAAVATDESGADDAGVDSEADAPIDDAADGDVDDGDVDADASDDASDAISTNAVAATGTCVCNPGFTGDGITCTDVAAGLSGLRWELPCGADLGGHVCAATTAVSMTALKGDVGKTYNVTLRFRGVVEQRTYTGGTTDGYWVAGALAPTSGDAFNIYQLGISSPAQTFYLNAGASSIYRCFAIDYQETIAMAAGAIVTLTADAVDGHEIENLDMTTDPANPIIVPGVQPAPAAYNGQFIQMDVLSVVAQ
ncbi:MAG TPA: calcium-binding EGF-like domain-containing protein [Polyangia bacterium]|jgi:hypothetical protein